MNDDAAPRTVVFFPEGAFGPTNNCVGIANVLRQRGHRVVFVVEESFAGTLAAKGFAERLMRLAGAARGAGGTGAVLERLHPRHGAAFPRGDDRATGDADPPHLGAARGRRDVRRRAAGRDLRRGAARRHRRGQRRRLSGGDRGRCSLGADRLLQPAGAGRRRFAAGLLRAADRGSGGVGSVSATTYRRLHADLHRTFDDFVQARGCPRCRTTGFMVESPYLTLYVYPDEADYARTTSLPSTVHRLDSSVRTTDPPFAMPGPARGRRQAHLRQSR